MADESPRPLAPHRPDDSVCGWRSGTRRSSWRVRSRSSCSPTRCSPPRLPSATARSWPPPFGRYSSRYAQGGLPALARAVDIEQRSGRHERLFVRVVRAGTETLFVSMPPEWSDFDVSSARRAERTLGAGTVGFARRQTRGRVRATRRRHAAPGRQEHREPGGLLDRFRTIVALVSVAIVLTGLAGGILVTRTDARADPSSDCRGQPDHPYREHRNARAGWHRPRRDRRAERLVQRDARSDQHAHRGHGERARQRRARPPDTDGPAAGRGGAGAGNRRCAGAARGVVHMPRGVRADSGDARHPDGHLRGRDRDDAARARRRPVGDLVKEVVSVYEDVAEEKQIEIRTIR